ncbi:MAG: LytR/AlgR family response regulator transcription factor [Rhodoferax sp.]
MALRIHLVDDNPHFLRAVDGFLQQLPHVAVVGQSTCGHDALRDIAQTHPHVVVLDLNLPDISGAQLAQTLRTWRVPPLLILTSMNDGTGYAQLVRDSAAAAFVGKEDFVVELVPILDQLVRIAHTGACP